MTPPPGSLTSAAHRSESPRAVETSGKIRSAGASIWIEWMMLGVELNSFLMPESGLLSGGDILMEAADKNQDTTSRTRHIEKLEPASSESCGETTKIAYVMF